MNYLIASVFWTVLVIFASLIPGSILPSSGISLPHFDKFVHFVMYTGVALFWLKYVETLRPDKQTAKVVFVAVLAAFLLGVMMEVVQHYWVENRHFELLDLIANGFGCIFGGIVFIKLHKLPKI